MTRNLVSGGGVPKMNLILEHMFTIGSRPAMQNLATIAKQVWGCKLSSSSSNRYTWTAEHYLFGRLL